MKKAFQLSLSNKLIISTTFFILATVLVSVFVTFYYGNQHSQASIEGKLNSGQSVQQAFSKQQAKQLELVSLLVASDPAFVAYIAEAINVYESDDSTATLASIADLLLERKQQYNFDLALVTTADGKVIARSDKPMTVIKDISQISLLSDAMDQLEPVNGFWQEQDSIYQASIIPLARGQNLIGFFITGIQINNNVASEIGRLSGTEILFLTKTNNGYSKIASSMDITDANNFIEKLNLMKENPYSDSHNQLEFKFQKYAIESTSLAKFDEEEIIMLTSVSIDQSLKPFITTRSILIGVGILMIGIALLVTLLLVKRTLSPIKTISIATKKIADGQVDMQLPDYTNKDLSLLNSSIGLLVGNIRGKNSLSKHMVEISKKVQQSGHNFWIGSESDEVITPGKTIGSRYKILQKIGSGGSGHVFKAFDTDLDELIVLKILKNQNSNSQEITMFKQEIRLARRILDSNIVRIHDFGQIAEHVFISMEYVNGYTLEDILNYASKLRPHAAKHASIQTCKGLMAAHEAGVIHRDLKPANLIVELDATVKLMDFGIATVQNLVNKSQTHSEVEGTTAYLSPEQTQGKGADERSDIYALGILMMEMFVGQRPFKANNDEELMMMNLTQAPTPISNFWADAPIELEDIILKCLEKTPSQRYQTVQSVMNDLYKVVIV